MMEWRDLALRPIFASLGLEGFRSQDFECCKETFYQIFLFVVFAGKKQPKHVGTMPEM